MKTIEIVSDYTSLEQPNQLTIIKDDQGDFHLSMWEDPENREKGERGVRVAVSGSRFSPAVRDALQNLMRAVEQEQSNPCKIFPDGSKGIVVQKQLGDDYEAHLESDPRWWERGDTRAEAIGKLVISNSSRLGLNLVMDGQEAKCTQTDTSDPRASQESTEQEYEVGNPVLVTDNGGIR